MAFSRVTIDPIHPDPQVIADAAARIAAGELVAFPTETVYGLGADACNPQAVARIYTAKGRPAWNPLIAHVHDVDAARAITAEWPHAAQRLAEACWPGPLTIVLRKRASVPDITTAGRDAVAVRIPSHPVALALLRAAARPIAAPSANRFTQVSPTTAAHVIESLGARVPLILDGGPCAVGIESTVIDLTATVPTILRPGMIAKNTLEAILGQPVHVLDASIASHESPVTAPLAPGQADRHYAPRAEVWLFAADELSDIVSAVQTQRADNGPRHNRGVVVAVVRQASIPATTADIVIRLPDEPALYARALYAALHEADGANASLVLIERPPGGDEWAGVRDRLARAAR
jgi:L-threonylcarbamoyladenylate synthase